jgi:nucleoside-diphosphate-sugar epimerase
MPDNEKVLILGATGGIGGEVARQLRDAGRDVRALRRGGSEALEHRDGITWIRDDAMNRDDVLGAAEGCSVIRARRQSPRLSALSGAGVAHARQHYCSGDCAGRHPIVLPGTIYNYGPDAFPVLREDSPQNPRTRNGAIRVDLERRLQAATRRGCRAIVVHAGDFFGPRLGNSWFSQGLVKPAQAVAAVSLPGEAGVGHQWSYLPDVARTMVQLLERRESLSPFTTFHMAGHWDADGTQMAEAVRRIVLRRTGSLPKLRNFPWALVALASPFVPTFRELLEIPLERTDSDEQCPPDRRSRSRAAHALGRCVGSDA